MYKGVGKVVEVFYKMGYNTSYSIIHNTLVTIASLLPATLHPRRSCYTSQLQHLEKSQLGRPKQQVSPNRLPNSQLNSIKLQNRD